MIAAELANMRQGSRTDLKPSAKLRNVETSTAVNPQICGITKSASPRRDNPQNCGSSISQPEAAKLLNVCGLNLGNPAGT
ncbi:hypothetical protein [Methyloceanibacter methanicus]|uniref:hypothetical protein n=1 Tax=Methyloceanibacter methanicus TaxID=1774968 RepID=UPI00114CF45D|nr:hypothetical protein [Methyloceanibacter methanicus]